MIALAGMGIASGAGAAEPRPAAALAIIDHLVYAVPDLDRAVADLETRLGVRTSPGGQHLGHGTRNALIGLGPAAYLEIIGPDPAQPAPDGPRRFGIDGLREPRIAAWAAKSSDLDGVAAEAARRGVHLGPVGSGSRKRPDGAVLQWRFTAPETIVADGIAPFFIDWGATPHPASSLPGGAVLAALVGEHPEPERVRSVLMRIGVDLPVRRGSRPALVATVETARGRTELR